MIQPIEALGMRAARDEIVCALRDGAMTLNGLIVTNAERAVKKPQPMLRPSLFDDPKEISRSDAAKLLKRFRAAKADIGRTVLRSRNVYRSMIGFSADCFTLLVPHAGVAD